MPPRKRDRFRHAQLAPLKRLPSVQELDAPAAIKGELCRCAHAQHDGPCRHSPCGCRFNRPQEGGADVE